MTSYNSKISVKIPPDIHETYIDETYISTSSSPNSPDSSSMQISTKTARRIAQKDEQFDLYNASPKPKSKSHLIMSPLEIQKNRIKKDLSLI